jgi:hypothetical protein
MRSAECQVAVAVAAARSMGVAARPMGVAARSMGAAASDPARLAGLGLLARADLGPQVLADFIRRPVDSDLAPVFVHLVQGGRERLLHQTGHSRREALCPAGTVSETVALDFVGFITGASDFLTTVSDAARPSSSEAGFFWDHLSILTIPATMATTSETITATDLRLNNSLLW